MGHLLVSYQFAAKIWLHFANILNIQNIPLTLNEAWSSWGTSNISNLLGIGNLHVAKKAQLEEIIPTIKRNHVGDPNRTVVPNT